MSNLQRFTRYYPVDTGSYAQIYQQKKKMMQKQAKVENSSPTRQQPGEWTLSVIKTQSPADTGPASSKHQTASPAKDTPAERRRLFQEYKSAMKLKWSKQAQPPCSP